MTKKFKNIAVISTASMLSVVLICAIATQFGKGGFSPNHMSAETESSETNVSVVTTAKTSDFTTAITTEAITDRSDERVESTTAESENNKDESTGAKDTPAVTTTVPPSKEVNQDFEPATKPTIPPPPEIKDESALEDMDKEPEYEKEQTAVTTVPPEEQPKNGQVNEDKIYVQGFGWIDYEGGGGIGEVNDQMYQNGNKIGYFG